MFHVTKERRHLPALPVEGNMNLRAQCDGLIHSVPDGCKDLSARETRIQTKAHNSVHIRVRVDVVKRAAAPTTEKAGEEFRRLPLLWSFVGEHAKAVVVLNKTKCF